jgi:peroxiredoxin
MKKQLITICILLFTCQLSAAITGKRTIIAGKFTDGRTDTLVFSFFRQHFSISDFGAEIQTTFTSNGEFKIILPEFSGIAYCKLVGHQWPRLYLDNYLIEPGDSIYITANPAGIRKQENMLKTGLGFSGNNPAKFRFTFLLNAFLKSYSEVVWQAGPPHDSRMPSFDSLMQEQDMRMLKGASLNLLDDWKEKLSKPVYDLMKADILYKDRAGKLAIASMALLDSRHSSDADRKIKNIREYLYAHLFVDTDRANTTDQARNMSVAYRELLKRSILQQYNFLHEKAILTDPMELIPLIRKLPIEDQERTAADLAVYLALQARNTKGLSRFMEYAVIQKDPWLAGQMKILENKTRTGSTVFAFTLPDQNGNSVSISQFKGKAVLIDFWFTGCIPCQALTKLMQPVKNKLQQDTGIVFMSISIDKEKDKWVEGLSSGLYTDKESVNLYTDGMGIEHPLLRYYGIMGVPKLLLVDANGKIFSSSPPAPANKESTELLLKQLEEASGR